MNLIRHLLLTLSLALSTASYGSSVWEISKDDHSLYLAGTMHVLSPNDYPLPPEYKEAYEASDLLVFETDVSAMNTPAFQQMSLMMLTYTDGTTLDDVLSDEALKKLKAHLAERGVPYDGLKSMKPPLLTITLSMIEFQRMGLTTQGIDAFYFMTAMGDGKERQWLESPEQQLEFIANMAVGDEDELILYSLEDLSSMPEQIDALKQAWREGDMQRLAAIGLEPWVDDYPDIHQSMFVDRNNNWMPRIQEMLTTPEVEMVLVGALHAPGERGLLAQLRSLGYSVRQLSK